MIKWLLGTLLLSSVSLGINPKELCAKPEGFLQWSQTSQNEFNQICSLAGVYEDSLLPEPELGKTNSEELGQIYDYTDFSQSLAKNLGKISKKDICEPQARGAKVVSYPTVPLKGTVQGTIAVSLISEDELKKIYHEIQHDPEYVFEVPEEGCWARSLLIAKSLEKRGIRTAKVFAEGPFWVPSKDETTPDRRWAYHVAPVVAVQTTQGVEYIVLDPSTFDKPVTTKTWGEKFFNMAEEKKSAKVYLTDRFVTAPLYGGKPDSFINPAARGRWHQAEVFMARQEMERLREEAQPYMEGVE